MVFSYDWITMLNSVSFKGLQLMSSSDTKKVPLISRGVRDSQYPLLLFATGSAMKIATFALLTVNTSHSQWSIIALRKAPERFNLFSFR
jgi:hypothetical protein